MSSDPDRIAVPTNGRGPHPVPDSPAAPAQAAGDPSDELMSLPFSAKQVAVGFGIVASLVLLLAGRARRGRSGD